LLPLYPASTWIIGKMPMPRWISLAALVESFGSADVIPFSAQFALRRRRSRALLTRPWLGPRQFLALA
jgi:hypothetical protein